MSLAGTFDLSLTKWPKVVLSVYLHALSPSSQKLANLYSFGIVI